MYAKSVATWQSMPNTSNRTMGLYVASTGHAIPISAQTFSQSTFFAVQAEQVHIFKPIV
jgi:hypothetical protein